MGVGGQCHDPAALPPGKSRYPLYRGLGGPQGRSGRVRKISPKLWWNDKAVGITRFDKAQRNSCLLCADLKVRNCIPQIFSLPIKLPNYGWFRASVAKQMRTALFWVATQRVAAILTDVLGQPIGPIVRGQESKRVWILKIGLAGCPESSGAGIQK